MPKSAMGITTKSYAINDLSDGQYEVELQRNCSSTASQAVRMSVTVGNPVPTGCLANKDYGKNLSAQEIADVSQRYNRPSPYPLGDMIGVNDGGLVFRSFQFSPENPIARLTKQYRNFHMMDEDFNAWPTDYAQNTKPKDTWPEGSPAHTQRSKTFYSQYRGTHGIENITASTELLQYWPQKWKEKIYSESDWSASGPSGIRASFQNYTLKFIDEFAPAGGAPGQILVANYQVGNEPWDYPFKEDYHSLLLGARDAFTARYGPKSGGAWKMKLVAAAFQAFRDNNCHSALRDFSNCGWGLERHDFVGDYLNVPDCGMLRDLDAVDCHAYSFLPNTNMWVHPEHPLSEFWQIRNMAAWLDANRNASTGVLANTRLWSTEFGYDSSPNGVGVGERTHSAYLLRGLLLHSRYHYEKVFFYNAYDVALPNSPSYGDLYNSSGFWRQVPHPANSSWLSPHPDHGASPKPAWFGMLDLKARMGGHVFFKALAEDDNLYAFLLAKPDSTDPYLVFWAPRASHDAILDQDLNLSRSVQWAGLFPQDYQAEGAEAQNFAESDAEGAMFLAADDLACGSIRLLHVRRSPAFIRLNPCHPNKPGSERGSPHLLQKSSEARLSAWPNPGTENLSLRYEGPASSYAIVRMTTAAGHETYRQAMNGLDEGQSWQIQTQTMPAGLYYIGVQTEHEARWVVWEKM
jgi:hypothetical protein